MSSKNILICVGAPKCGTTWLYQQAKRNSEFFNFPCQKEIDFWNCYKHLEGGESVRVNGYSRSLKRVVGRLLHYDFTSNYNEPDNSKVYIDFSPSYMSLTVQQIENIKKVAPCAKFILCTRRPADRIRSHYKYALRLRRNFYLTFKSKNYIKTKKCRISTSYKDIYDRICNVYDKDSVIVLRYEAMFSDKNLLEKKLLEFTGIPWDIEPTEVVNKTATNESRNLDITDDEILAEYHDQEIFWKTVSDI